MRYRPDRALWLAVHPTLRVMLVWFGAFAPVYLLLIPHPYWPWSAALALAVTSGLAAAGAFRPQSRGLGILVSAVLPPLLVMVIALGLFKILPADLPAVLSHSPMGYEVPSSALELRDALHAATHRGDARAVARLLGHGAPPDRRTRPNGLPPLALAASRGDQQIVRLLLEAGADPSPQVRVESHPVVSAVRVGDAELLILLLEAAAAGLPETVHKAARELAVLQGKEELAELLDERF